MMCPLIHLIIVNTMQFRHICDNASMTAVVLYSRYDLLGNIHYLPLREGQSRVPTGDQGGDNRKNCWAQELEIDTDNLRRHHGGSQQRHIATWDGR
jgi:hypothetical protein